MDNQENQEDNIKEKRPRGRPRKPKPPAEEPKEPKPLGRPRKPKNQEPKDQEPKRRGRPQIYLIKPAYKPKDPDYFKKYYQEKTKIKRLNLI
jgi:hypothetical protein